MTDIGSSVLELVTYFWGTDTTEDDVEYIKTWFWYESVAETQYDDMMDEL
jgi:hypothetical protein